MKKLRAIIVSLPGTWQRVLQENIETYAFVKVIEVVSGSLAASDLASQYEPEVILIDSSIPFDEVAALVRNLKRQNLNTKSIVITDTTQQRRKIIRGGADYTISSYNYEAQIGEILDQLKETLPDVTSKSGTTVETKVHPSK